MADVLGRERRARVAGVAALALVFVAGFVDVAASVAGVVEPVVFAAGATMKPLVSRSGDWETIRTVASNATATPPAMPPRIQSRRARPRSCSGPLRTLAMLRPNAPCLIGCST